MKTTRLILIVLIFSAMVLPSCKNKNSSHNSGKTKVYTCSMHPQVIRNEPGNCPICGMALVEKISETAGDTILGMQSVLSPVFQKFLFSQKTVKMIAKVVPVEITVNGIITYDTHNINNISSRVSGRIDKLFIKYSFQQISKGQKIFEIYSPDLQTAQQNLLYLIKNDPNENGLIDASKEKLRLLGMKDAEIKEVLNSGKAKYLISVYSDYKGYAVNKNYSYDQNDQGKYVSVMSSGSLDNSSNIIMDIKEGDYVKQGEDLFRVIDISSVWAILKIELNDYPYMKTDQKVDIFTTDNNEAVFTGKVNYIETPNPSGQKTVNVRVYLNNTKKQFKIGQLISAKIHSNDHAGKWIPSKSVLDLGKRKIVFVKKNSYFVAKVVVTGIKYDSLTEILSGLNANDEIASDAQFFGDSESFIKSQNDEK